MKYEISLRGSVIIIIIIIITIIIVIILIFYDHTNYIMITFKNRHKSRQTPISSIDICLYKIHNC